MSIKQTLIVKPAPNPRATEVVFLGSVNDNAGIRIGDKTYYLNKGDKVALEFEVEKPVEKKNAFLSYPYGPLYPDFYKPFRW